MPKSSIISLDLAKLKDTSIDKNTTTLLSELFSKYDKQDFFDTHRYSKKVTHERNHTHVVKSPEKLSYFIDKKEIQLKQRLFCWEKNIAELGLSIKKFEIDDNDEIGRGTYGVVYGSAGTLKIKNKSVEFSKSKHGRVIKEAVPNAGDKMGQRISIAKEASLLFHRAHYTHTKSTEKKILANAYKKPTIITRKFHGKDLEKQLATLTPLERVTAALQMVKKYLTQIENNRLIHYDLKPANFIFDPKTGKGRYIDFGFSEKSEAKIQSVDDSVIGSPIYSAFEVLFCKAVGKKTDYYSLGRSLQELFGDHSIIDLCDSGMDQDSFTDHMVELYSDLEKVKNKLTTEEDIKKSTLTLIWNFHHLNLLFEDYNLSSTITEKDQESIKSVLSKLLQHQMNARSDTLDESINRLMLIQSRMKYKCTEEHEAYNVLVKCCQVTFDVFKKSCSSSFEDLSLLRTTLLDGLDKLLNYASSLSIYADFLELDGLPDLPKNIKGKNADARKYINEVFDLYTSMHDELLNNLQVVAKLIAEKPPADNVVVNDQAGKLDELFLDVYNQLSRKERRECSFNEIADLANSWKDKVPAITKKINAYLSNYPQTEIKSDSYCEPELIKFSLAQRKILKVGLKYMRAKCDEETVMFLNHSRHYAALFLQNSFLTFNASGHFFYQRVFPCVGIFSRISMLSKELELVLHDSKNNTSKDVLKWQEFFIALTKYAELVVVKTLIRNETVDPIKLMNINLVIQALSETPWFNARIDALYSIRDQLSQELTDMIEVTFPTHIASTTTNYPHRGH